jgi:hypothetical protein
LHRPHAGEQSFLDSPYCTKIEVSSFLEHCRSRGMVLFP